MAGFLLGAGSGVLAGAAVYYTLSTGIQENTALLRAELASSTRVLSSSFDPVPAPAASSLVGPAYPAQASFSELLRHKWNNAVGAAVSSVRDANWSALGNAAVGAAAGAANRIGQAAATPAPVSAGGADVVAASGTATDASAGVVPTAKAAKTTVEDALKTDNARFEQLRKDTNVDAPLRASPVITESPKRLV